MARFHFRTWHDLTSEYDTILLPNMARLRFRTWRDFTSELYSDFSTLLCTVRSAHATVLAVGRMLAVGRVMELIVQVLLQRGCFSLTFRWADFSRGLWFLLHALAQRSGVTMRCGVGGNRSFVMKWVVCLLFRVGASATRPAGFLYFAKRSVENAKIAWWLAEIGRLSESQSLNLSLAIK